MSNKDQFVDNVIKMIDRWSFEQCAFCEEGTMVSIEGMINYKCSKCGKSMKSSYFIGEIAKLVFKYREELE